MTDEPLWTQREAAESLHVTTRYLRASSCPKVLLPSLQPNGRPIVRYSPAEVRAWREAWTVKQKAS